MHKLCPMYQLNIFQYRVITKIKNWSILSMKIYETFLTQTPLDPISPCLTLKTLIDPYWSELTQVKEYNLLIAYQYKKRHRKVVEIGGKGWKLEGEGTKYYRTFWKY